MREELIPSYIAYAVIIITADHLGESVSCLDLAKWVWETKSLPEPIKLGTYQKAAHDARQKIHSAGLEEKANRIAELFYRTGKFEREENGN